MVRKAEKKTKPKGERSRGIHDIVQTVNAQKVAGVGVFPPKQVVLKTALEERLEYLGRGEKGLKTTWGLGICPLDMNSSSATLPEKGKDNSSRATIQRFRSWKV